MKKWLVNLLKTYFFTLFPLVVVFSGSLFIPSDSDLGWHLKYGEYFFNTGTILRENIYSTEMVGYPWINSSWAIDLVTFFTFKNFGFLGLTLLAALVITLTFFFFSQAASLSFFEKAILFPLLLYLEQPLFQVSFRGHLITLFFISVVYFLFSRFEKGRCRAILLTILVFLLWSNLHGEFILGLGILGGLSILYLLKTFRHQKSNWRGVLLLSVIGSIVATLINPFGLGVYQESLKHFGNPLQQYIIEWLPFERFSILWWKLVFWGLLVLLSLVVLIKKKRLVANMHYAFLTILLLALSFWMRRYTWPMVLISLPIVKHLIALFSPPNKTLAKGIGMIIFIIFYLQSVFSHLPKESIFNMNWDKYCFQYVGCSKKAAEFLIENELTYNLLTFYNWGGWLIYHYYPKIKPSIDGRMHLWQDKDGFSAFAHYYPLEQAFQDIDQSGYDVVLMTPAKPMYKRLLELVEENKWEIAYQDKLASVFVRKNL